MKYLLITLMSLVLCNICTAQVFNKNFNVLPKFFSSVNIEQTASDTITFLGANADDSNNKLGITVFKLNFQGDSLSSHSYFDSTATLYGGLSNSTNKTKDGGFVMGGGIYDSINFGHIVKFDSAFNLKWSRSYGDTVNFFTLRQAIPTNDGGIIAIGNTTPVGQRQDGWLLKTDSLGNILWQKTFSTSLGTLERLFSVQQTSDGGYILGGHELEFPNQPNIRNYDPIIIKVDSLGNQQWRYRYDTHEDNAQAYAIQTMDGNYVFSSGITTATNGTHGRMALFKVNNSGSLIWAKTYGRVEFYSNLLVVKELPDSSLIAAGRSSNGTIVQGMLVHTKANGDSIFVESYERIINRNRNQNILYDVIPMADGGFMACGQFINHSPFYQDAWVIRVDSMGCILNNCSVGLNDVRSEFLEEQEINVFPNPSKDGLFNIKPEIALKSMQLLDINARFIREYDLTQQHYNLPSSSGIYLLRLEGEDGSIIHKKVIRE